jgi:hypothetical protein
MGHEEDIGNLHYAIGDLVRSNKEKDKKIKSLEQRINNVILRLDDMAKDLENGIQPSLEDFIELALELEIKP